LTNTKTTHWQQSTKAKMQLHTAVGENQLHVHEASHDKQ